MKYIVKEKSSNTSSGISVAGVLQIIFIVLKLIGVIDWGWGYVLLPTLIPLGFGLIILIPLIGIFLARVFKN